MLSGCVSLDIDGRFRPAWLRILTCRLGPLTWDTADFTATLTGKEPLSLRVFGDVASAPLEGPADKLAGNVAAHLPAEPMFQNTDLGIAIQKGLEFFERNDAGGVQVLFLLTDGQHQPPTGSPYTRDFANDPNWQALRKRAQALCQKRPVFVYGFGLGPQTDVSLLLKIFPTSNVEVVVGAAAQAPVVLWHARENLRVAQLRQAVEQDLSTGGVEVRFAQSAVESDAASVTQPVTIRNRYRHLPVTLESVSLKYDAGAGPEIVCDVENPPRNLTLGPDQRWQGHLRAMLRAETSNLRLGRVENSYRAGVRLTPITRFKHKADYVEQYLQMRFKRAQGHLLEWLLPEDEFAVAALESRYEAAQIRARYAEHYAADILRREDRDSLAEMIERLHTAQTNGSLTSRIGEGLQFCLLFWNIRVPGSQYATEALLVGLERENTSAPDYFDAHAVAQRGQVYAQIVPTAQDSVILISRIAHGASYYWHAQDEIYFREYSHALTSKNFFLHLRNEWRTLPEPLPAPNKYERRVFALGLAYEFIAVRGSAYYLDLRRQYSLAGTTRHTTADWRTIPLLSAVPPSDQAPQPANPNKTDLVGDGNRWETMQRFVEDERMVSSVREKLQELFNEQGREAMRGELGRYCQEVLESAIGELEVDELAWHQLNAEYAETQGVIDDLTLVTGILKLSR